MSAHYLLGSKSFVAGCTLKVLLATVFVHVHLEPVAVEGLEAADPANVVPDLQMSVPQVSHHHTSEDESLGAMQAFNLLPILMVRRHVPGPFVMALESQWTHQAFVFLAHVMLMLLMGLQLGTRLEFLAALWT